MLPGLEVYLSKSYSGYAQLVATPQYPHVCLSFDNPARYVTSLSRAPESSLLFVVLRGRSRIEDVSWRVYVNDVKVSRVFKPQHVVRTQSDYYYAYVADITPVTKGSTSIDLVIKCHAPDTHVEVAGLTLLIPEEFGSDVSIYLGISNVEGEHRLTVSGDGFSVISIVGQGRGGIITLGSATREVRGSFEFSDVVTSDTIQLRGPLDIYAIVVNKYVGIAPDVLVREISVANGKIRLLLANPGSYKVSNVDVRLLRGTSTVGRAGLSYLMPGGNIEVVLDNPSPPATGVKITFEFSGHVFTRSLPLNPSTR